MDERERGLSRRGFLFFWRRQPDSPPPAPTGPPLRPPGIAGESLFVNLCLRCGRCVEVCPADALFPLGAAFGAAEGTPAVDARKRPCVLCTGLQCTHVCPSGALTPLTDNAQVRMGTAVVDEARCVTYRGE